MPEAVRNTPRGRLPRLMPDINNSREEFDLIHLARGWGLGTRPAMCFDDQLNKVYKLISRNHCLHILAS